MRFLTCKGKDNLLDRLYMIINASPRVVTKYKKTRVLFFLRLFHDADCWGNFKLTYLVETSFSLVKIIWKRTCLLDCGW